MKQGLVPWVGNIATNNGRKNIRPYNLFCFGTIQIPNRTDRRISKSEFTNIAHWSFFHHYPYLKVCMLLFVFCEVLPYHTLQ